ncbi:VOC family protein [Nocardia arthritidis]|uniref:Glyoxalase-like domain-containing protein n=1 Tax=Nocardia arthritidis TaxID=228602 RepID=A0A6G9YED5_9NOCA|nr:hypothetical protein [Nocardia arthritidis]QIS11437.1 hypothetical protein F5544_17815 [Nocardia arthritidis]
MIVDDLDELIADLTEAAIIGGPFRSETGRYAYLRHSDGTNVEYVQWSPRLRARILANPVPREGASERLCEPEAE